MMFASISKSGPGHTIRRRVQRIVLAIVLASITLASGCGQSNPEGPVEIVFWHAWGGFEGKFLEKLVEEFNETHQDIHVRPSHFVIGDKLMAAIAGGIPPDVVTVWDWMLPTMGEAGCFFPLNEYLAAEGTGPDDYLPNIWEYGMFGDSKYGVPTALNVWMLFYNRRLLAEAGYDESNLPSTIDELRTAAQKLTVYDENGKLQRIGFIPQIQYGYMWMWNFGGQLYDPKTRKFVFNSPENRRAMEWIRSFYKEYGIDTYRRFEAAFGEYDSPNNPFYKEKLAIREDGQWQLAFVQKHAPDMEYGLIPFVSGVEGKKSMSAVTGSFWVIPTGCKHPDQAWEFLSWLIAAPQSARFAAELCNIPPTRAALEDTGYEKVRNSRMKIFIDFILEGRVRPLPALPVGQYFYNEFNNISEAICAGQVSAEEGLQQLDERLQNELDRSLRHLGIAKQES